MADNTIIGRLALRKEGTWHVAYFAKRDTMDGALELGRIRFAAVEDEGTRTMFMELMKRVVSQRLHELKGKSPSWTEPMTPKEEQH